MCSLSGSGRAARLAPAQPQPRLQTLKGPRSRRRSNFLRSLISFGSIQTFVLHQKAISMSLNLEESEDGAQPGRVCDRCLSMTSTVEGLRALISKEGYKHSGKGELEISAEGGCPVCTILYNDSISDHIEIIITRGTSAFPIKRTGS